MITRTSLGRVVLFVLIVFLSACGKSSTPTAPSIESPAPSSSTGSATITGTLAQATSASTGSPVLASVMSVTISITGTGISTSASPGGTFVLNGVPGGTIELHFTGPGIDARATVTEIGEGEEIRLVVTLHGSNATVAVTDRKKPAQAQELEGLISAINLAARTMVVNGTNVSVPTTATIRHGNETLSFSQLKLGQRVHVRGTLSGSTMIASEVKLQDENPPEKAEAEVEGTVSAQSGSCPTLTFLVKTTKVATDAGTAFKGGTCAAIANGVKVEVEGVRQADGSIKATKVELKTDKD